jgi:hypothetical protein
MDILDFGRHARREYHVAQTKQPCNVDRLQDYTYHRKGLGRDITTTYDQRGCKPCTANSAGNKLQICETIF